MQNDKQRELSPAKRKVDAWTCETTGDQDSVEGGIFWVIANLETRCNEKSQKWLIQELPTSIKEVLLRHF